jgi:hypothetical protein
MAPPRPRVVKPAGATSVAPLSQPIGRSLASNDGLARLLARVRESQARLDALQDAIPAPLRAHLRAGPLDEEGWTILAANSAVAAKLRHLAPLLAQVLVEKGWEPTSIRIRVQEEK